MGRRVSVLVCAMLAIGVLAAPATAGPPDRFEENVWIGFPDVENGVVVMVNITREAWCTPAQVADELAFLAWLQGGMQGPPPESTATPPVGIEPVQVQVKETGQGAIVARAAADDLRIELWPLDADAALAGPCTDTDEAEGPLATGTTTFRAHDNDFFGSDTRANAFGDRGHAQLTTATGEPLAFSWVFHVNTRCYAMDAPPACEVAVTRLG